MNITIIYARFFMIIALNHHGNCIIEKRMQRKSKLLPTLSGSKTKGRTAKDKLKIEDLIMKNRNSHKDYRSEEEFAVIKANNFLSRVDTLDSPQVIFAISDQIKQAMHSKEKQNIEGELTSKNEMNNSKSTQSFRMTGLYSTKNTFHRQEGRVMAQEREEALELARWLDEKLGRLRVKKTITFMDILEYKQTILNYALGKIIDSLSRRCKEEGQILSLIWESTFKMFESVFTLLVDANRTREKQNTQQTKELHQIFETNHNFLREQNSALKKENQDIFNQMRKVITWNKRLRKDRKTLHTSNKILQYRNVTYSQALQETLQMLLQSTPDPAVLQTAKKVILKLGKEKNRKKRCFKQQIDSQLGLTSREIVYNWLKKNSCLDQQRLQLFKEGCFKEDGFLFSELDDINEMKKVDIYDFFKLFDVAVQAVPTICSDSAQCDQKIYKNVQIMTKNISTIEHGCQTIATHKNSQASIDSPTIQKKVEINASNTVSANKQLNNSRYKRDKTKTPLKGLPNKEGIGSPSLMREKIDKETRVNISSNMQERARKDIHRDLRKRSANDFYFREKIDNIVQRDEGDNCFDREKLSESKVNVSMASALKIEEERPESDHGDNSSISELLEDDVRTKGLLLTTRNIITNNSQNEREKSLADFNYQNINGSNRMIQMPTMANFKRRDNHKRSMAYIKNDFPIRLVGRLLHNRKFNEVYSQEKEVFENNKEQFIDQIIRRRSFFTKRRVEFNNYRQAEDVSDRIKESMRGTRYGTIYRKKPEKGNMLATSVDKWTKRGPAPSNIAKSKALISAKGVFEGITGSIEQAVRIPPKNKMFVNNSISSLAKYISDLVVDYLRQIKRQKQEIPIQCEKALYPLSVILMERMTFKYGLKEIAERKIKHFIEKVLTFASISEKISLYSLLLGLDDNDVGSDQLLVYLKCLVYFEDKKPGRDTSTDSNLANLQLVRENLRNLLQYFFDGEYLNLVQLKLQIYFQQSAPYTTIQGISLIIIRELLRRKKQLRLRYSKVHAVCTKGDNFFSNLFHLLRVANNYRYLAGGCIVSKESSHEKQAIDALKEIKTRANKRNQKSDRKILGSAYDICKISQALRELLKRADIMDEQYGKAITQERFITAAMLLNLPNAQDLQAILEFMRRQFTFISSNSHLTTLSCEDFKSLEKLARAWNKSNVQVQGEPWWAFTKIYNEKVEEQVFGVMGKLGSIGSAIEGFLFNQQ